MKELRQIKFYKDHFISFYLELPESVQKKYEYVFVIVKQAERIPVKFFKKISGKDNLFEIRVESNSNIYRTFCCLDGKSVVILFNSFQKKTRKTPPNQIKRAEKLQNEYYEEQKK